MAHGMDWMDGLLGPGKSGLLLVFYDGKKRQRCVNNRHPSPSGMCADLLPVLASPKSRFLPSKGEIDSI